MYPVLTISAHPPGLFGPHILGSNKFAWGPGFGDISPATMSDNKRYCLLTVTATVCLHLPAPAFLIRPIRKFNDVIYLKDIVFTGMNA